MKNTFLVPSYYGRFICKGKACRDCCCTGWNISLSMQEYFSLLGIDCSKTLRYKLDGAFHLAKDRSPEEYAQITPRFDGDCPLHLDNGFCALQYECGEDVLPKICRYYPRSPRFCFGRYEASMSNSCEAVIEALDEYGFSLESKEINFELELDKSDSVTPEMYFELRNAVIAILSKDSFSLNERLTAINILLEEFEFTLNKSALIENSYNLLERAKGLKVNADTAMNIAKELLSFYATDSVSIGELCENAIGNMFSDNTDPFCYYAEKFDELLFKLPRLERLLTDVLKNHFFYEKFPFSDKRETIKEESLSLMGLYILIKSLLCGNAPKIDKLSDAIDILGSVFRLAEHSSFYKNTAVLLERAGYDGIEDLFDITICAPGV